MTRKNGKRCVEELGLTDAIIIGHVGRIPLFAKNHEYLIRVFAEAVPDGHQSMWQHSRERS
ncbi:MAG: hypothetical protein V8S42_05835 [Lachnospiraceae bacterium]